MKYFITSDKQRDLLISDIREMKIGEFGFNAEVKAGTRTLKQNSSMYLFFTMLAAALNDAGLDMQRTLKPGTSIPWNANLVKEWLWRPVQKAQLDKHSTTKLTRAEVSEVYETLNRHLANKFGISVSFPDKFRQ